MSDDAKWILAIGLPVIGTLAGLIWKLLSNRIDSFEKAIWDQVGRSSKEGMRVVVHDSANMVSQVTPTLGEHSRRLDRLESKVFNGGQR